MLVACDADLLNEHELLRSVPDVPSPARTASLLAALYERHGEHFVERLRGGFSVVLWDLIERRLIAAVDGFGIKRLAWHDDGKVVSVASRADALRASSDRLSIDPRAIVNVLNFSANLGPGTIFAGVHRLPPGVLLIASETATRTQPYWDMSVWHRNGISRRPLEP